MQDLKDRYSEAFVQSLADNIQQQKKEFPNADFMRDVLDNKWKGLSLKERMKHIRVMLHRHMEEDFESNVDILIKCLEKGYELEYLFVPDYIQAYGISKFELAMRGFENSTEYCSAEFGMRPFIEKYPNESFEQLKSWSLSNNEHLRRLASECCRPLLPWGGQIKALRKDPSPILPLINLLCEDDSEYVRRSAANNLNDISKDHPELALSVAEEWTSKNDRAKRTAKHGMRTLLKGGHQSALSLFGLGANEHLYQRQLQLKEAHLKIGQSLEFSFEIHNDSKEELLCRLEYKVYFVRKVKAYGTKVFKISQKSIAPGMHKIKRKQHFKNLSTRKHYPGEHFIEIILNGRTFEKKAFHLVEETD